MFRTLAGIALGVLVASVVVYGVDTLGHVFHPLPADLNYDDIDAVRHFVNGQPFAAKAFVIAAFLAGAFAGGLAAGWMIGPGHPVATMMPALLVAGGVWAMHRMAPHPLLMVAVGIGGSIVLGWAGAGLGGRLRQPFMPKPAAWRGGSR
jgi:hypothetical protein